MCSLPRPQRWRGSMRAAAGLRPFPEHACVAQRRGTREHAPMRVNHLHLMVPNVPEAAGFFEKYFELRKESGNAGLTVLLDDSGFVLTLMKMSSKFKGAYPAHFHVGFFLDSEAQVDAIHGRM